jgi:uncharacterized protein (DUF433 family)
MYHETPHTMPPSPCKTQKEKLMARYSLNLPERLKHDAERWAASQGVSLNQFILWAVAEKVGNLGRELDDPRFPQVTYRRGASGGPVPVVVGTGIRVQTLVVAARTWGWSAERVASEYGLRRRQVEEALGFAEKHSDVIEATLETEAVLERASA